ncbi:hypothetical protein PRZ48_009372 [Zasmidium cellare]|uniref:SET domain-containing protein n=1 Tax=Zasmidium cellare TaxID=395010 RepID=A0ABR0EBI6_ZASCE|nr:hypothetical protein PRZ48_009372 [Zasmidium cellare]
MAGKKEKAKARKAAAAATKTAPSSTSSKKSINQIFFPPGYGSTQTQSFKYFEIKAIEGKGLGAFATRPIKAFTTIYHEQSIMTFYKDRSQVSENDLIAAYEKLSPQDKYTFDTMRNCHGMCGCKGGLFFANTFGLRGGGVGCFPNCSRLNHSCQANCMIDTHEEYDEKKITVLKDLKPGDELTFHYVLNTQFMTNEERQELLTSEDFGFVSCRCQVCTLPPADKFISDSRRQIMRHLLYWIEGADLNEVPPASLGPHPGDLPDMVLASHILLFCHLAEAEGVVVGSRLGTSFAKLIHFVIFRAAMKRVRQLPERIWNNVQTWWKRAQFYGTGGSVLDYRDIDLFNTVEDFISCVRDDGEINWKEFQNPLREVTENSSWSELCLPLRSAQIKVSNLMRLFG